MSGGAPKNNQNAKKGRILEDMLRNCAAREDYKRLRQGCEVLLNRFAEGDDFACGFVRDTLDGKPKQALDLKLDAPTEERVSAFSEFLAEAIGGEKNSGSGGLGDERPLVPAEIPPTTH